MKACHRKTIGRFQRQALALAICCALPSFTSLAATENTETSQAETASEVNFDDLCRLMLERKKLLLQLQIIRRVYVSVKLLRLLKQFLMKKPKMQYGYTVLLIGCT